MSSYLDVRRVAAYDERAVGTRSATACAAPRRAHLANKEGRRLRHLPRAALRLPQDAAWLPSRCAKRPRPEDSTLDPSKRRAWATRPPRRLEYRRHDGANQHGDEAGRAASPTRHTYYKPSPVDKIKTRLLAADPVRRRQGRHVTPGFLTPHWYRVKPFALKSSAQFRPRRPQGRLGAVEKEVDESSSSTPADAGAEPWSSSCATARARRVSRATGSGSRRTCRGATARHRKDIKWFFAVGNVAMTPSSRRGDETSTTTAHARGRSCATTTGQNLGRLGGPAKATSRARPRVAPLLAIELHHAALPRLRLRPTAP